MPEVGGSVANHVTECRDTSLTDRTSHDCVMTESRRAESE